MITLSKSDLKQISEKGITEKQIEKQIENFKAGFPFLKIENAASVGNGIITTTEAQREIYINLWKEYKSSGKKVVKFVPASGAASRMFKDLFHFIESSSDVPSTEFEKTFFDNIEKFAFYEELDKTCVRIYAKTVKELISEGNYKDVLRGLLDKAGLNYGQLPKGLLLFHNYDEGARTSMEEHLVEAALYAVSGDAANIHFTVSHEHLNLFQQKVAEKQQIYADKFGVKFNISFSEQKQSTDTVAANMDNTLFRNDDGTILFRPGGHGALIENLNEIDADVVFIKNIDNVVPDYLKAETVTYKQVIAGLLVDLQNKIFDYLKVLNSNSCGRDKLLEVLQFVENDLYCRNNDAKNFSDTELICYLKKKLNRPIRVCGVVKNVGEPGGGPFLTYNQDGTISLQILESSQIDKNNVEYAKMFHNGTHFNPVDLVCSLKDYTSNKFNIMDFVDSSTGFISIKSKNGKELKALELPGLWNGAMSDWNTVFVEVPIETFNPVKNVNDLLRKDHQ
ncbi:MAG: DUF4301 family protein [Prevotella sp.]|uniref:DUF4301 family protein n=1 Tax=Prevotella sp. TaxID=59823 RepID=UPI002A286AFC|nr:DUF4301 family protein [Prevotella sp.]MDD7318062.1 DUF4301 family protein [Prevotellaceae bacterium]MDY4021049.1 DUF4301 family protein [Prevotella sp.]